MEREKTAQSESAPLTDEPRVLPFVIRICEPCLRLAGAMCHNPECIFVRRDIGEVALLLKALMIRDDQFGVKPTPSDVDELRTEVQRLTAELGSANAALEWYEQFKDEIVTALGGQRDGEGVDDAARRVYADLAAERAKREQAERALSELEQMVRDFATEVKRLHGTPQWLTDWLVNAMAGIARPETEGQSISGKV